MNKHNKAPGTNVAAGSSSASSSQQQLNLTTISPSNTSSGEHSQRVRRKPIQKKKKSPTSYKERPNKDDLKRCLQPVDISTLSPEVQAFYECDDDDEAEALIEDLPLQFADEMLKVALDEQLYKLPERGETDITVWKPADMAIFYLRKNCAELNEKQIKQCLKLFTLITSSEFIDEAISLFSNAQPFVVEMLANYLIDEQEPCAARSCAGEALQLLATSGNLKKKTQKRCFQALLKALTLPAIQQTPPDHNGLLFSFLLDFDEVPALKTMMKEDATVKTLQKAFQLGCIDETQAGGFDDYLLKVGGEALVMKHYNDELVQKCTSCGTPVVIEQDRQRKEKHKNVFQVEQQVTRFVDEQEYEKALLLISKNMMNVSSTMQDSELKLLRSKIFIELGRFEDALTDIEKSWMPGKDKVKEQLKKNVIQKMNAAKLPEKPQPRVASAVENRAENTHFKGFNVTSYKWNDTMMDEEGSIHHHMEFQFPFIVYENANKHVVVYDVVQDKPVATYKAEAVSSKKHATISAFKLSNNQLFVSTSTGKIYTIDMPSVTSPTKGVTSVAESDVSLSRNTTSYVMHVTPRYIATYAHSSEAQVKDRQTGDTYHLYGSMNGVTSFAITEVGGTVYVLAGCGDSVTRIYTLKKGVTECMHSHSLRAGTTSMVRTIVALKNIVISTTFNYSNRKSEDDDDEREENSEDEDQEFFFQIWDVITGNLLWKVPVPCQVSAFSLCGNYLAVGLDNGDVQIWKLQCSQVSEASQDTLQVDAVTLLTQIAAHSDYVEAVKLEKTEGGQYELLASDMNARAVRKFVFNETGAVSGHKICGNCGKFNSRNKLCSGCNKAYFCSKECIKMAWPQHKPHCKK